MPDMEKVINEYEDYVNSYISLTTSHDYEFEMHKAVLALLKEQEERLRKLQKDKDKLCLEVSEWKHKFHDRPEQDKEIGHWIVLKYCAIEGIYCSKCLNKIFDRSTKPKKKLSNYCPNCGSKNTHFFNPSTDKIMYSD